MLLLIISFMPCAYRVLCKKELERQLDLLKRKAFKSAKQMGVKGKVQF